MRRNEDTAIRVRSTYERILAPGDTVFDEGDPGDHLYVIQSGEIELTREGNAVNAVPVIQHNIGPTEKIGGVTCSYRRIAGDGDIDIGCFPAEH